MVAALIFLQWVHLAAPAGIYLIGPSCDPRNIS